jgi:hypothetical protein
MNVRSIRPRTSFPFPTGSASEEIAFLINFVNGDWDVWQMDGMRAAFLHVHKIDGHPATNDRLYRLQREARGYLETIAAKRRPRIEQICWYETVDGNRKRRQLAEDDFSSRVRHATQCLVRSRRAIRICEICESFFRPHGRDAFCIRCRDGSVAHALRLEQGQQWARDSRARAAGRIDANLRHLERVRATLEARVEKNPANADRRELWRILGKIEALTHEHHGPPPPTPPGAFWETPIQIGADVVDVNIDGVPISVATRCTPIVLGTFRGTYAEVLERFRASRASRRRHIG